MKRTGQLLRENREKQNISINAVSAATKISVKVLEAIEAGQYEQLPPKTFVRGFVQTYARFLKLDPQHVLDLFHEEVGTTKYAPAITAGDPAAPGSSPPSTKPPADRTFVDGGSSGVTKWLLAGLALFLFVAIYLVSQTVQKYKKESVIADPSDVTVTEPLPTSNAGVTESPSPSPESESLVAAASPISSPSPSPTSVTVTVAPTPSPTPTPTAAPKPSPSPSQSPSPSPIANKDSPQEVSIEALDTVKIDFRMDGGPIESITLQAEQTKKFSAKKTFVADISDGGAISITLNGKDKGVPGNLGQPLKVSFP